MAEVSFEYMTDSYSCETCGTSYSEGYRIFIDGILVKELKPVAHCYNGTNFDTDDLISAVLEHFGHKLKRSE